MEIISSERNCLGTMSFCLKLGNMRKAEEFVTYPLQAGDSGETLCLQSHTRWAELNTKTGAVIVSDRHSFANYISLAIDKAKGTAKTDQATPEQLSRILEKVRGTASPNAGGNNCLRIYCDNSAASLV